MSAIINELSSIQINTLSKRIPYFELSYEKISHKKVFPNDYSVYTAIPTGKKYCAWFSFDKSKDVCYLIQLIKTPWSFIGQGFLIILAEFYFLRYNI